MRGTQFAELSVFVAVAEQTSFTKAAKRLGLSNATLSQSVRELEERLGVRLLNRTTRSVALTDAGERLLKQLRPLLDEFDAAIETVNAFRDKPAGHLRLTAPPPIARFVLTPILPRFLKQYPEITVEISVETGFPDIVAGRFDAGFRRSNLVARDMIAVRVTDDLRAVVVASPDYLARHGRPQTPSDLQPHNCLRFRCQDGVFIPWEFAIEGKTVEFDVAGSVVANDPDMVFSAVLEGVGIVYTLEGLDGYVAPMIADGRLVSLLEGFTPPSQIGFSMFYPSRRHNPAALQVLIEFLRTRLRAKTRASKEKAEQENSKAS